LRIETADRGLAVAGQRTDRRGERFVVDPATGRPAQGEVLAAVVVAHSAADADAISTALVASGFHRASDLLSRLQRVEAVLLVAGDGEPYLLASGTLADRLTVAAPLEEEIGGRVRYLLPPVPGTN
jgi:thiamine biosynthesis lipoprotein ApbE